MTIHSHFTMIKYQTYSKMAGCSVKGCTKRSEHGYIVLRFPRDCARRQLWAKNCSLSNYDSNKYYFICEVCSIKYFYNYLIVMFIYSCE